MKGLLMALIVLALIMAGVVSAQDEVPVEPVQEVEIEEAAPVETITMFKVMDWQVPVPQYIRLDASVNCTATADGGLYCAAAPAEE